MIREASPLPSNALHGRADLPRTDIPWQQPQRNVGEPFDQ
jgi:hypothetical protein